jgi:hypothetical protein
LNKANKKVTGIRVRDRDRDRPPQGNLGFSPFLISFPLLLYFYKTQNSLLFFSVTAESTHQTLILTQQPTLPVINPVVSNIISGFYFSESYLLALFYLRYGVTK